MGFGRATPQSAVDALDVALVACHRGLEGLRRVRRKLEEGHEQGPEPAPEEVARLHVLAATSGATLTVADDLPAASELAAGLLLSVFRMTEALLRFGAGGGAAIAISWEGDRVRLRIGCGRRPDEWLRPDEHVERVRERVHWFDGRLLVEPADEGSRATIDVPAT